MAYYQVNLTESSRPVRDSFRKFAHVDADFAGDHIIVAATEAEIADVLRKLEMEAAANDTDFQYPAEMQEISPATIINGATLRERFAQVLVERRSWKPRDI